jgi:glycosyltransferase involved in cell wall biosynthesis
MTKICNFVNASGFSHQREDDPIVLSQSMSVINQARPMDCRLLYVVGQLGLGGLERQLFYLIRSMDRKRYKPIVAVWGNASDDHYAKEILALDVPVVSLGNHLTRVARLRALRKLVCSLRPEVIHSCSFYTNFAVWWAALGTRVISVGSIRSNFLLDRRETGNVLGRLCGRWPASQISNSFTAEKNAKQFSTLFRPQNVYVISNGVDLERFYPQSHPQQGYILAVGSLYTVKRWDRLIRAAAFLNSKGVLLEVLHVGAGPLRQELESMIRDLHVEHVVRFMGARLDIPTLFAQAAFLVHTAEEEGCPNAIMEALACGRAVVATDAGDVPHLVDDGKTGFVVPRDDENALIDRIETLLRDRELCCRMGNAARIKAERMFGIERLRVETFAAYRAEGWRD